MASIRNNNGFVASGGGSPTPPGTIPVEYIEVTYAEAQTLVSNSGLTEGSFYKITDRGDLGIILQAVNTNSFSSAGTRIMIIPTYLDGATTTPLYIFNSPSLADPISIGSHCIWGGQVWQNTTGSKGTFVDKITLGSDWVLVPKSLSSLYYKAKNFCIKFDFDNDWISFQQDDACNIVGISYYISLMVGLTYNPVDHTDWGMADANVSLLSSGNMSNNHSAFGIFNNTTVGVQYPFILNNNIGGFDPEGGIIGNVFSSCIQNECTRITGNEIYLSGSGQINENTALAIYNNFVDGVISGNRVASEISGNTVNVTGITQNVGGSIQNNSNTGEISGNHMSQFSTISQNSNTGEISRNKSDNISSNSNTGDIVSNLPNVASNSNSGSISSNSNSRTIGLNTSSVTDITNNTNSGNISSNSNTGLISNNSNSGNISNNSVDVLSISSNSNSGSITLNGNTGDISYNSNIGDIESNISTTTDITFNSNNGNISSNENTGVIAGNTNLGNIDSNGASVDAIVDNACLGSISENTIAGDISKNSNNGSISQNSNTIGSIENNSNNGNISSNTTVAVLSILNNTNNGNITGNNIQTEISYNSNSGDISTNTNSSVIGKISYNSNVGNILDNEVNVGINYNSNNGDIESNSISVDEVVKNSLNCSIVSCLNVGKIDSNSGGSTSNLTLPNTLNDFSLVILNENYLETYHEFDFAVSNLVSGVAQYFNAIPEIGSRIAEVRIVSSGLTGVGASIQFGIEVDDPTYITPTAIAALNATPVNNSNIGLASTATFRRFAIQSSGADVTAGVCKIWVKLIV